MRRYRGAVVAVVVAIALSACGTQGGSAVIRHATKPRPISTKRAVTTPTTTPTTTTPPKGWSIATIPDSSAPGSTSLVAIACLSVSSCTAVGDAGSPLIESWNGSTWASVPGDTSPGASLSGISCAGATSCVAVGKATASGYGRTYSEVWNGNQWSSVAMPNRGAFLNELHAVACPLPTFCLAVGYYDEDGMSNYRPLVERWNGSSWSIDPSLDGSSARPNLVRITCLSSNFCMAVGASSDGSPFAASWDGTTWSVPDSGSQASGTLAGVSCTSPTLCIAVGEDGDGTDTWPLIESWNGSAWSVVLNETTNSSLTQGDFGSVSCTAQTACIAVGLSNYNSPTPLIESWNGTSWSRDRTPDSSAEPAASLTSVSCVSMSECVAIGYFGKPGSIDPFMEFTAP